MNTLPPASQIQLAVKVSQRTFTTADNSTLQAVGELAFELETGSFTCIVGPSGCGKTTTLRMILGLDEGYEGSVSTKSDATLAAVFQEPRLLPWRTVLDNVKLAQLGRQRNTASPSHVNLDSLFEELGLDHVTHLYPTELSLGLARRAALARAFAVAPDVLVLDEPFVSLDEMTAARLRTVLLQLWRHRKATVLMVTHNVREAAELADRVLVFSDRPARLLASVDVQTPQESRGEHDLQQTIREVGQAMDQAMDQAVDAASQP